MDELKKLIFEIGNYYLMSNYKNNDVKYVCSKLNWRFTKPRPFIDRFKIEEEEYQELDKIIFRLNAIKEVRGIPLDAGNYSFSYKYLSS